MTVQIVCFSYSTEFVARPHLNPFPVAVRLTYSQSLYCLPYFFVIWGFAFPIGWILNSVFSIIWRRGRIVSFATPSVFLIGSPFSFSLYNEFSTLKLSTQINAVNWACPVTDFQLYSLKFRTCKHWDHIPPAFGNHCFPRRGVSFHFLLLGWGTWMFNRGPLTKGFYRLVSNQTWHGLSCYG